MNQNIEITLKNDADAFAVQKSLSRYKYLKCHVVDCHKIRIWFNSERINLKKVIKLARTKDAIANRKKRSTLSIRSTDSNNSAD